MSGVANPASDVIIVMGDDPDGSGGGCHRPQRKRVRTTKVLEMEQQNGDMEWRKVRPVRELWDKTELGSRLPPSQLVAWSRQSRA
ncbi:hypothetical protein FOMG_18443 [Fusarium oxysporum f. sp. melonis 26406]|uniref:Uncharacterized protein n=1 Tax=Fusarium oxysporum f. sp. melonis 26406 TaxID=1089452 RepID=W9Z8B0_FUSOX|nr:hypothetical protein FOMG_18443 [Fusarium oxysporum f. sp. melonis 26406]